MEEVQEQLQNLQAQLEATKKTGTTAKFVYAVRKLSKFSDQLHGLDDWIQEARSTISNMGLAGEEASEFLVTHLEGNAKREVRVLTTAERLILNTS